MLILSSQNSPLFRVELSFQIDRFTPIVLENNENLQQILNTNTQNFIILDCLRNIRTFKS